MSEPVPTLKRLTSDALALLLTEGAPAIRLRNAADAVALVGTDESFEPYPAVSYSGAIQATDTLCDAQTLNRYYGQIARGEDWDRYYADHRDEDAEARVAERIALIEAMLTGAWPFGAGPLRIRAAQLRRGVTRLNRPQAPHTKYAVAPHIDLIPSDVAAVTHQFSCNLYLAMPPEGGELVIWDIPEALVPFSLGADGEISDARLPPPIHVRPDPGDVIILNSRKPHAVFSFSKGLRATHSCFLDIAPEEPIAMWV